MTDLTKSLENLHLAIQNAQDQCDLALAEIEKLKRQFKVDDYMAKFQEIISGIKS